jgi:hypothetical protein
MINEVAEQGFRSMWPVASTQEIWEWAAEAVDFGTAASYRGKYDVNNVPWTREILRAFRDPTVREITTIMPPQEAGKTTAAEICLGWRIKHSPAKMAWNTVTNVKADSWSETRWDALLRYAPSLQSRFSENKNKKKRKRVIFRDGTFLLIQGAEVPANRQSDSIEVQFNDEVQLWERPWHEEMLTRLRAYREVRKIMNLGLGGDAGSELEERWLEGSQLEWCHICPACRRPFPYVFNQKKQNCNIRFDLTKVLSYDDGRLDLREFEPTIRTFCSHEHCGHEMRYDPDLWARLNFSGVYVSGNPAADPGLVSIRANAFAIGKRPWVEILKPWARLNTRGGLFNSETLKKFITTDLCEFWVDKPIVVNTELVLGSYQRIDMAKPPVFDSERRCVSGWADEILRLMSVDNQHGAKGDVPHRWFVCRAFARDGRSRLVDCGRINEWQSVKEKADELGITNWTERRPGPFVVVDRRFEPVEVDEICAKNKWYGMMGFDATEFVHSAESAYAGKRMQFSEDRYIDIGYGTQTQGRRHAIYFLWASQRVQDFLAALRGGGAETWELPADLGNFAPQYQEHINSHRQRIEEGKAGNEKRVWYKLSGWADHLYDCECMLVVLGLRAGLFKRE